MIIFKNLDITAFKSIFHCNINFLELNNKLYFLEGKNNTENFAISNGSGKSTLCSALAYVLYGSTDNTSLKKAEYQNKNTSKKLKLILNLDIQNIDYTIERTDSTFKLFKGEEDISELNKTDTEKKFLSILQLTKAEFYNFTYLSQNSSGSFLSKTPTEKLNCIKDFIFGEELLKIDSKINSLLKDTKQYLNNKNIEISNMQGKLSVLEDNYRHKEDIIESFPYDVEYYKNQLQELNVKKDKINQINRNISLKEQEYQACKQKIEDVKLQYIKAKDNICPTCGQHLLDNTVIDNLKIKANDIKLKAQQINQVLQNLRLDLDTLGIIDNKDIQKLSDIVAKINYTNKYKQDYNIIENNIRELTEKLTQSQEEKQYLEFKINQITQLQKYFKTDFIKYIQQSFLSEIENYLNIYCHDIFNEDFKLDFTNNTLELTIGGKPYSYFSGGEQQRIDFIFVFAIKVALSSFTNKSTNLFICDESLSGQDSQAFENCINLISDLTESEDLTTILVSHRDIKYQQNNKIVIERFNDKTKLLIS